MERANMFFSLNVDFFNVERLTIRGASTSCGIISAVCLHLPLNIRYKPENMYVCLIPSPNEPHLTELNHYIRPIVDDMVVSWSRGHRFSQTPSHPNGHVNRMAFAAAVCDLPAARKLSQMTSVTSHFYCSVCQCYHTNTLGRADPENWVPRDVNALRRHAEQWRNASTSAEQTKLLHMHGVRWSELWRLPYWNPVRQLVIDSMHCVLEGLAQHHTRDVLGLTMTSVVSKPIVVPAFTYNFQGVDPTTKNGLSDKEVEQVHETHALLAAPIESSTDIDILSTKLMRKNVNSLRFICSNLGCTLGDPEKPKKTKMYKPDWVAALLRWVSIILHLLVYT